MYSVYMLKIWTVYPLFKTTNFCHTIDDVTSVYLQHMQGIGLSIYLNELLHYSMAYNRACVT